MMTIGAAWAAGLVTLIVADLLWLGVLMRPFYMDKLGHLMAPTPAWWAAGIFYVVYTLGVWWFAVNPTLDKGLVQTAIQGALFGAIGYAIYDLTNQATLRDWPIQVTLVDIAWGAFMTALMSVVMVSVVGWMAGRA